MTDRADIPPVACVMGANQHESVVVKALVDDLPAMRNLPGRPYRWPRRLHAHEGCDSSRYREHLERRGIQDCMACQGIECIDRFRCHRRVPGPALDVSMTRP